MLLDTFQTGSNDIDLSGPIILDEESYRFIREAARRLRGIDPEETTIKGHVTALISRNNPLSTDEKSRHVTIRWSNRGGGRAVDVSVFLQREDYILAFPISEFGLCSCGFLAHPL